MRFLVFQHVEVEGLAALADAAGIEFTIVDFGSGGAIPPDLRDYDAMVVMGGPMDVWQTNLVSLASPRNGSDPTVRC